MPASPRKEVLAASIHTLSGIALAASGHKDDAERELSDAARRFAQADEKTGQYLATVAEGIRLSDEGRKLEALRKLREAEAIDRLHKVSVSVVDRYKLQINIVSALIAIGDTEGVIRQLDDSLSWLPFERCSERVGLLLQKGNYSALHERYDDALGAYREGAELAAELRDEAMRARLLSRIALCHRMRAEQLSDEAALRESIDFRHKALEAYAQQGDAAEALNNDKKS